MLRTAFSPHIVSMGHKILRINTDHLPQEKGLQCKLRIHTHTPLPPVWISMRCHVSNNMKNNFSLYHASVHFIWHAPERAHFKKYSLNLKEDPDILHTYSSYIVLNKIDFVLFLSVAKTVWFLNISMRQRQHIPYAATFSLSDFTLPQENREQNGILCLYTTVTVMLTTISTCK